MTDYASHDHVYVQLRASGADGWSGHDDYRTMLAQLHPDLGRLPARARVLELGCGAGNLSMELSALGFEVHGADIAPTAVAWANERAAAAGKPANFVVDDVVQLARFPADSFDAVIDGHCLHCIVGDDRSRCFSSISRVLRPGGVLIVLTMCGDVISPRLLQAFDPHTRIVSYGGRPSRYIGRAEDIVEEVRSSGLRILEQRVDPRTSDQDQDDLVIVAGKPPAARD